MYSWWKCKEEDRMAHGFGRHHVEFPAGQSWHQCKGKYAKRRCICATLLDSNRQRDLYQALCQKNAESVEIKQRPIKMRGRITYWTLPPKQTPFQTGIDRWPNLWKMPTRRRISHTYPNWDWQMTQFVKGAYKKTNQPHISYVIVRP
jgi:hypothetical protein